MFRRSLIFGLLALTLLGVYSLSRMVDDWHYVVPAADGELLYATSFDGTMDDWGQDERSLFSVAADGGVMRINVLADNESPYSAVNVYFDNFDVRVEAQVIDGMFDLHSENSYGLIFRRLNKSNYYAFVISGDGYYRILRITDGSDFDLTPWNDSESINQGTDVMNRLRVIGYDNRFQFFINDVPVQLCIPDNPIAESTINSLTGECIDGRWKTTLVDDTHALGQIALVVDGDSARDTNLNINFDNVLIYAPQPILDLE